MDHKQFSRRVVGVVVMLALLLTFLCSNLYTIQYTNGPEYAAQSVAKVSETETVAASRGNILDRNGKVLVSNQVSYNVTLDLSLLSNNEEKDRCDTILALTRTATEMGVTWTDTLPITTQPPFEYTTEDPFYTTSVDEDGKTVYNLTSLGKLAVNQKWIQDPEEQAEAGESEKTTEPGLLDKIKAFFGMGSSQEETKEEEPYRLPTAEELLGKMCKTFDIAGEGKVDEKQAQANGETVPTLNIGDMDPTDARTIAGILYELYYRNRISSWPPYTFATDVSIDFITRVKELSLPGVEIETTSVRKYNTEYAAHLLGYTGAITSETWPTYKEKGGYTMNDYVGITGAESAFESYLKGTSGTRAIERNETGKIISSQWLTDSETGESLAPQPGQNVFLTIDIDLQEQVENILANGVAGLQSKETEGAACVVLDVNSGDVLASASYPTYSLATFSQDYNDLAEDPLKPLLNRALQGLYPPGSTFKMITAIAALELGIVEPNTQINDKGVYTFYSSPQPQCWYYRQYRRTHGLQNVSQAIMNSCNYYFYEVGRLIGIDLLDQYAAMFGLGQKTGIELTEQAGVVASPAFTESLGGTWYEGNILSVAIGQESTQVTPIQLANYIATLVNGGTRYSTHLLKTVKSNDFSQVTYNYEPKVVGEVEMEEENRQAVMEGMLMLTTEGSVSSAFKDVPVSVGAKTGSAQVSAQTNSNAVFVCFAPYDDPQIAVAIAVEHGGSGSELGKIAAQIVTAYFSVQGEQGTITQENTLVP